MARPRKPVHLSVSPHQALYVLEKAVFDRKLSEADVNRYVAAMHHEISSMEERLIRLKDAVVGPVKRILGGDMPFPTKLRGGDPPFPKKGRGGDPPFPKKRPKKPVSAERAASQQLQGQYLGYMRQVPERQRARIKQISKDLGREKAIAEMKKLLGK